MFADMKPFEISTPDISTEKIFRFKGVICTNLRRQFYQPNVKYHVAEESTEV